MYQVYANGKLIYDSTLSTEEDLQLISPKLEMSKNNAGTFSFTLPITHKYYDTYVTYAKSESTPSASNGHKFLLGRTDCVSIYKDDDWLWEGAPLDVDFDLEGNANITCDGAYNYLDDVKIPLSHIINVYQNTNESDAEYAVRVINGLMTIILNHYNSRVTELGDLFGIDLSHKKIDVGTITGISVDTENPYSTNMKLPSHFSRVCNFESCKDAFEKRFLNDFGGQFYITKDNAATIKLRLNYRFNASTELISGDKKAIISLGENLLDYDVSSNFVYATSVIVQGNEYDENHSSGSHESRWWLKDTRSYAYDITQRAGLEWRTYKRQGENPDPDNMYPTAGCRLYLTASGTLHKAMVEKYGFHDAILQYDDVVAKYPNDGWASYGQTTWKSLFDYLGAGDEVDPHETSTLDHSYVQDYMCALEILGRNFLETQQFGNMTIQVSATEINAQTEEKDHFIKRTGELMYVSPKAFRSGSAILYEITQLSIALDDETETTITMGGETTSLTRMVRYN